MAVSEEDAALIDYIVTAVQAASEQDPEVVLRPKLETIVLACDEMLEERLSETTQFVRDLHSHVSKKALKTWARQGPANRSTVFGDLADRLYSLLEEHRALPN